MRISDWSSDVCSSDLEAHRSQDRGDVYALCSYRGQAGAGCGRTGGKSAAGDYRGIPFYGGASMTRKTHAATRKPAALPAGYDRITGGTVEVLDPAAPAAARPTGSASVGGSGGQKG